jgi:pimeloyl-ACP methyl ester carboxylesterase
MIERKWVDIDGTRIFYLEAGSGNTEAEKPVLLFIHGFLMRADGFDKLIAELSADYRIFAPDLPGCGESGYLMDPMPTFAKYAGFIHRFCEELKLKKPAVIGHSMGGGITIAAAALFPGLFRRAVLIDSISYEVKQPFKVKVVMMPGIGRFIFMRLYGCFNPPDRYTMHSMPVLFLLIFGLFSCQNYLNAPTNAASDQNESSRVVYTTARDIDIGANNWMFIIGAMTNPQGRIYQWTGPGWSMLPSGAAMKIAVEPKGAPWVITSSGTIHWSDGDVWLQAQ